jgi:hypothetical protein
MMAKTLAVTCLVILLASFIFTVVVPVGKAQAPAVTIYVNPPNVENASLVPGTTFNVSVKVDNIPDGTSGVVGVQFFLSWNSSVLNAVSMEEVFFHSTMPSSELGNLNRLALDVKAGNVSYAFTYYSIANAISGGYAPVSGNHTIANIQLRVVGVGKCALHIDPDSSVLGDRDANSISFEGVDGSFSNLAPPPPPKAALLYVYPGTIVDTTLTTGHNFTININILNASGLSGLEFKLGFNASVLQANSVAAGGFIPGSVTPITQIDNTVGFVKFNVSLSTPLSGDGNVTVVQFLVQADKVRNSTLHLSDVKLVDSNGQALAFGTADGSFTNASKVIGDLNGDGVVNIKDAIIAGNAFGSAPGDLHWNPDADLYPNGNGDGDAISILDIIVLASNFHM